VVPGLRLIAFGASIFCPAGSNGYPIYYVWYMYVARRIQKTGSKGDKAHGLRTAARTIPGRDVIVWVCEQ